MGRRALSMISLLEFPLVGILWMIINNKFWELNISRIFGTLCLARAGKVHPFSCRHLEKAMAEKPSWKSTSSKYVWDRVPQIHTLCSNPFWFISYALTFSRFYEKFMLFMKIRKWWNLWYSQVSIKRAARWTTYIYS